MKQGCFICGSVRHRKTMVTTPDGHLVHAHHKGVAAAMEPVLEERVRRVCNQFGIELEDNAGEVIHEFLGTIYPAIIELDDETVAVEFNEFLEK